MTLAPHHARELFEGSGISQEVAAARGYRTITAAEARTHGYADYQCGDGLFMPSYGPDATNGHHQLKRERPRISTDGKPIKYETPAGSTSRLDVPPTVRDLVLDERAPLIVTEGYKKGDAAASIGRAVVALTGVFNFTRAALADWAQIPLHKRPVDIAFDSDAAGNRNVQLAEQRLRDFLTSQGARVRIKRIPPGPNGEKRALDDLIAAGATPADIDALPDAPPPDDSSEVERLQGQVQALRGLNDALRQENARLHERDNLLWRALTNPETCEEVPTALAVLRLTTDLSGEPKLRPGGVMKLYDPAIAEEAGKSVATVRRHRKRLKALGVTVTWTKPAPDGKSRVWTRIDREVDVLRRLAGAEPVEDAPTVAEGRRRDWGKFRWQCREHPRAGITIRVIRQCAECGALAARVAVGGDDDQVDSGPPPAVAATALCRIDPTNLETHPKPTPSTVWRDLEGFADAKPEAKSDQLDRVVPKEQAITLIIPGAAPAQPPPAPAPATHRDQVDSGPPKGRACTGCGGPIGSARAAPTCLKCAAATPAEPDRLTLSHPPQPGGATFRRVDGPPRSGPPPQPPQELVDELAAAAAGGAS